MQSGDVVEHEQEPSLGLSADTDVRSQIVATSWSSVQNRPVRPYDPHPDSPQVYLIGLSINKSFLSPLSSARRAETRSETGNMVSPTVSRYRI